MTDEIQVGVVHGNDLARKRKGAASELRAAAHLMDQGFDVYRCEAPVAPFDLVAHRAGQLLRVEVKSWTAIPGRESCMPSYTWPANDQWDLLLIVNPAAIFQFTSDVTRDQAREIMAAELGVASPQERERAATAAARAERALVLTVMALAPVGPCSTDEIFDRLVAHGWDPRRPAGRMPTYRLGNILSDMYHRGMLERPSRGLYALPCVEQAS